MTKKHLNYCGPANTTGYGYASIGYLEMLSNICSEKNIDLAFSPIGNIETSSPELSKEKYKKLFSKYIKEPYKDADTLIFWHLGHLSRAAKAFSGKKYAISTFEVVPSLDELKGLIDIHSIACASNFNRSLLTDSIKMNAKNISLSTMITYDIVDHKAFNDYSDNAKLFNDPKPFLDNLIGYNFDSESLFLSSIGKFESRKGLPEFMDALDFIERPIVVSAFWHNPFIINRYPFSEFVERNWIPVNTKSGIKLYKKGNKYIILFPPVGTREELYTIASSAHYFISLSKAEGYNLPLADMVSIKMPCIFTDTAKPFNSSGGAISTIPELHHCITVPKFVPAVDDMFFNGTGKWGKIDILQIAQFIETVKIIKPTFDKKNFITKTKVQQNLIQTNLSNFLELNQ